MLESMINAAKKEIDMKKAKKKDYNVLKVW